MSAKQPNIVVFFWDNFGWGELGCYGGGVPRGAPTPRIDKFCSEGKQHLGSDVDNRSPVDFGFDEAVWSPRTAGETSWPEQSYFPNGKVTAKPYAGEAKIPVEPQTNYSRKRGEKAQPVARRCSTRRRRRQIMSNRKGDPNGTAATH